MFCPNCEVEYRFGFTMCTDCDVELVESLDEVPEARRLEPFHVTHNPDELGEILEVLEHEAVPYVVRAGTALALIEDQPLQDEGRPDRWEARISVVATFQEQAQALLGKIRAARAQGYSIVRTPLQTDLD